MTADKQAPIRVRFDARMIANSGIGTQIQNVLQHLIKAPELDLHLLGDPVKIYNILPEFNGTITRFTAPVYSLREQFFFPRPAADEILHIPHYNAPFRYLPRAVVIVHDIIHLQSPEFSMPHYRAYSYMLLKSVARRAGRIAAVSETTRMEFLKHFPEAAARTSVIYNGINHRLFRKSGENDIKKFRKKYNLPTRYLLSVGIGKQHKNVHFLIRSLARQWHSGDLKLPLVLAGTGGVLPDYLKKPIAEAGAEDQVILMPYLDTAELPTLYSAADLFILPSLIEGFGFPIIEAMASGTPVMASAASSLPEIGADAARYFDPRDTEDFLRVLNEVLGSEELREKMVRTGLQRARDFEWRQHAEDLIKLYREFSGKVRLENELND